MSANDELNNGGEFVDAEDTTVKGAGGASEETNAEIASKAVQNDLDNASGNGNDNTTGGKKKKNKKKNKKKGSSADQQSDQQSIAQSEVSSVVDEQEQEQEQEESEQKESEQADPQAPSSEIVEDSSREQIEDDDFSFAAKPEDEEKDVVPPVTANIANTEVHNENSSVPPIGESTPLDQTADSDQLLQKESSILEENIKQLKISEENLAQEDEAAPQTQPEDQAKPAPVPSLPPRHIKPAPPQLPCRENTAAALNQEAAEEGSLSSRRSSRVSSYNFRNPIIPVVKSPESPSKADEDTPPALPPKTHIAGNPVGVPFPPPPVPPQLTSSQKAHQRSTGAAAGGITSWLRYSHLTNASSNSVASDKSDKSIELSDNYDLLLKKVVENNEDYLSKDEVSKEQINTSARTLKEIFHEKFSQYEDSSISNTDDSLLTSEDRELHKIDWPFWTKVVNDYSSVAKTEPVKLSEEISGGIPPQIRGIVWQLVSNSNPKEFETVYKDLLLKDSVHEKNIRKDLSRTSFIEENNLINKKDSLFNVIKAYSIFDSEVGYTQGMAFITVPLLLNMDELEAFSMLKRLMFEYNIRSLYLDQMPGLELKLYQFDRLIEDKLPDLFIHFKRQGIRSSMYATQWFLTFFAYKFPLEFVLRIFDMIITEGFESILKFSIALLEKNEKNLILLQFDDLLQFLKEKLFNYYLIDNEEEEKTNKITVDKFDVNRFIKDASIVKILPITLKRYSDEYEEIFKQEKERQEEVDELRIRNNQLRKEMRKIEASYTLLNREHVQIANEMISGRIKIAELEDEKKDLIAQNTNLRERIKMSEQKPTEEIPVSLEEDLKQTMNRNLEVMTKNQELEEQISQLLQQIDELKNELATVKNEEESTVENKEKKHISRHSMTSPLRQAGWKIFNK